MTASVSPSWPRMGCIAQDEKSNCRSRRANSGHRCSAATSTIVTGSRRTAQASIGPLAPTVGISLSAVLNSVGKLGEMTRSRRSSCPSRSMIAQRADDATVSISTPSRSKVCSRPAPFAISSTSLLWPSSSPIQRARSLSSSEPSRVRSAGAPRHALAALSPGRVEMPTIRRFFAAKYGLPCPDAFSPDGSTCLRASFAGKVKVLMNVSMISRPREIARAADTTDS